MNNSVRPNRRVPVMLLILTNLTTTVGILYGQIDQPRVMAPPNHAV